jgi:hypothetical protein
MVHPRAELAKVGEADAEFQQRGKFIRRVPARRDADLLECAPKAIAGMRVVMAEVGRTLGSGGADKDEAEVRLELVGEFFQPQATFRQIRNTNFREFMCRKWPAYRPAFHIPRCTR